MSRPTFPGREQLHLGLSARAMLRPYAQDPVARVLSRCVFFFSLSLRGSLPSLYLLQGVFELIIMDGSSRVLCHRAEGFTV